MNLFSDAANEYSENMSEQVGMVEVKTEHNTSDELFSVSKTTNIVANYSEKDGPTSESRNYSSILLKISFK